MDLCNLYDFYTSVFTLAFTPCTFNVLFYVRIKYYNNNKRKKTPGRNIWWLPFVKILSSFLGISILISVFFF